ncbi:hypothetical protein [Stenotrophomonas sp. 24(2023)]|uniref:hypothetical protein n=1 Tax=Stenotrophomonas sp. 24(2023) TaxID=3068324 RepID=UPI0027E05F28|nr:hypothetical protein [Stenotrophomonas sp. 24(2023)]WMJ71530.1 hypothetical protein Q9R17_19450 [Stenotrophomonas sp. 24(2023)]
MHSRWRWAAGVLGVVVVAVVAGWMRSGNSGHAPVRTTVAAAPDAATVARIERLLADDTAFRDDLVFLIAATLRDRCQPVQAGLLARMANRASLPVLAAVNTVTTREPALDRPLYRYIQHLADSTGCGQPLRLAMAGGAVLEVDVEQYAAMFPDSYFDPRHSHLPRDFDGRPLAERVANACNSVVYSVLPLGGNDWRCSSLRAHARQRVRGLCEDELQRQHGSTAGELDAAVGQGMAPAVVQAIAALPAECR